MTTAQGTAKVAEAVAECSKQCNDCGSVCTGFLFQNKNGELSCHFRDAIYPGGAPLEEDTKMRKTIYEKVVKVMHAWVKTEPNPNCPLNCGEPESTNTGGLVCKGSDGCDAAEKDAVALCGAKPAPKTKKCPKTDDCVYGTTACHAEKCHAGGETARRSRRRWPL